MDKFQGLITRQIIGCRKYYLEFQNSKMERKMSNLIDHAKREFLALGYKPIEEEEDGPNKWIQENVLELLQVFSEQGHSGFSAGYCINTFKKLANFEPLGPLTGKDSEWVEVSNGLFQNSRCSHVFKRADRFNGQAYDIYGRVFRDPDGYCYTNSDSHVPVTFPYVPKTEYVDRQAG
jgi:hypothetical protein